MAQTSYSFQLANHQIRLQATQIVGCQPGDCSEMAALISLKGLRLCRLTYFIMTECSAFGQALEIALCIYGSSNFLSIDVETPRITLYHLLKLQKLLSAFEKAPEIQRKLLI